MKTSAIDKSIDILIRQTVREVLFRPPVNQEHFAFACTSATSAHHEELAYQPHFLPCTRSNIHKYDKFALPQALHCHNRESHYEYTLNYSKWSLEALEIEKQRLKMYIQKNRLANTNTSEKRQTLQELLETYGILKLLLYEKRLQMVKSGSILSTASGSKIIEKPKVLRVQLLLYAKYFMKVYHRPVCPISNICAS